MKLRLKGDTLRIRLSQTEVDQLGTQGNVMDSTPFQGSASLQYQITRVESESFGCTFKDGKISLSVPQFTINQWVDSDQVGFEEEIQLENSSKLSILVEKDFKCLTKRPEEDESDLYPNPLESH